MGGGNSAVMGALPPQLLKRNRLAAARYVWNLTASLLVDQSNIHLSACRYSTRLPTHAFKVSAAVKVQQKFECVVVFVVVVERSSLDEFLLVLHVGR